MTKNLIAKKSLGQNFLRSEKAVSDMINAISEKYEQELKKGEIEIVEIGGGEGVISKALLEKGFVVNVIELDQRAIEMMSGDIYLQEKIKQEKLRLYNQDVLNTDFREIVNNKKYILIGNIPYYITGLIFRHTFEQTQLPLEAIYMTQKEVTDRVIDAEKESILSLSIKAYGQVRRVAIVKRGSFVPAPNVDSAIIHISEIENKFQNKKEEEKYFLIIKTAFKHKRKIAK
jgi:16S rRNA (adenine1518-N6/adenine1519-N6)-dimethyltransferase